MVLRTPTHPIVRVRRRSLPTVVLPPNTAPDAADTKAGTENDYKIPHAFSREIFLTLRLATTISFRRSIQFDFCDLPLATLANTTPLFTIVLSTFKRHALRDSRSETAELGFPFS